VALFVRPFRRGRGDEFLETRIIPKRIEHWIESEQRWSKWPNNFTPAQIDWCAIQLRSLGVFGPKTHRGKEIQIRKGIR
jgi:hypothetical protein